MSVIGLYTLTATDTKTPVYSEPFTSDTQPYFVGVIGDFSAPDSNHTYGTGYATIQYQMEPVEGENEGRWVDLRDRMYRGELQDMFRLPPGTKGRVRMVGCTRIDVQVHDSKKVAP